MRSRFRLRRDNDVAGGGFQFQDVGAVGWTVPTMTALDLALTRMDPNQVGSRLYLIDPDLGNDATGEVLFWDATSGGRLVNSSGSPTGLLGLPYGTDPLNPNLSAILPFKRYNHVAPRTSGDIGSHVVSGGLVSIASANGTFNRAGKPDWWLIRRGRTLDLYDDARGFLDANGLPNQRVHPSTVLISSSGKSASERAIVGSYGPTSDGRARITNPWYAYTGKIGTTYQHTLYMDLLFDGSNRRYRSKALRPADWTFITTPDQGVNGTNFTSMGVTNTDIRFEGCMWYGTTGVVFQWAQSHTTIIDGITLHRCIVVDAWGRTSTVEVTARKTTGDQVFDSAVPTAITFPTKDKDTTNGTTAANSWDVATGTFTVPTKPASSFTSGKFYYRFWPLMDVTATVPVSGSLKVAVTVNGAEKDSYVVAGTGITDDTYRLFQSLNTGRMAIGDTAQVVISTVNGTGNVNVLGTSTAQLQIIELSSASSSGCFMQVYQGSQFAFTSSIFLRNGFGENPILQTSYVPNGSDELYDWDIRNHNWYFVGPALGWSGCIIDDCVTVLGAAGDLARCPVKCTRNFFYTGYYNIIPEHNKDVFVSKMAEWNDNVFQRYRATTGTTNAHNYIGLLIGTGAYGVEVKRNIISEAGGGNAAGFGSFAVKIAHMQTPYFEPYKLLDIQPTENTLIDGNIFDSSGTQTNYDEPIIEANGTNSLITQWGVDITSFAFTDGLGTVLTAAPKPGYTVTTGIAYQWYRWDAINTDTSAPIPGATNSTYTIGDHARANLGAVGNQAAMLALAAVYGDYCQRSDLSNQIFEYNSTTLPPTNVGAWNAKVMKATGTHTFRGVVADQAGMVALGSAVVGDFCKRSDKGTLYELVALPASTAANWTAHSMVQTRDWGTDSVFGGNFPRVACEIKGVLQPIGAGIKGTVVSNNVFVKPATKAMYSYYNSNKNGLPPTVTPLNPSVVTTAPASTNIDSTINNRSYTSRTLAGAAEAWPNSEASLITYMAALGVPVSSGDGFVEYYNTVVSTDAQQAMRRDKWDDRLTGIKMGNHVRVGRNMLPI
jgi:hypothetical protein